MKRVLSFEGSYRSLACRLRTLTSDTVPTQSASVREVGARPSSHRQCRTRPGALRLASQVLVEAKDLLLYGAAKHSAPFVRHDERLAMWISLFNGGLPTYAAFLDNALDTIQVAPYSSGRDYPQTTGSF
ncbi:hypothetical protein LCGC14_2962380 [marine sediment metagenome]|uniref:Uncharacterized protein n=1 Tax=marine sediment metagenome TaxID=412755 RepID=A0A0F8XCP0_9ZZZZ